MTLSQAAARYGKPEFELVMQEYSQGLKTAKGGFDDASSVLNNSGDLSGSSGNSDVLHTSNNQMDKTIVGDNNA